MVKAEVIQICIVQLLQNKQQYKNVTEPNQFLGKVVTEWGEIEQRPDNSR